MRRDTKSSAARTRRCLVVIGKFLKAAENLSFWEETARFGREDVNASANPCEDAVPITTREIPPEPSSAASANSRATQVCRVALDQGVERASN
jgi:hypothetical protein